MARAATPGEDARRRYRPRADVKISQLTRQRFRQFVRQTADARAAEPETLVGRWFGWLFNLLGREHVVGRSKALQAPPADLLPQGIERTAHEDRHSMFDELPRARQAFSKGEAVLAEVMGDIRSGKPPQLDAIDGAVDSMVESMLDNPDALMWIARLREEDINTYNHGVKVALYLVALGRHLGFPQQELAYLGQIGMLADIGKTKVPRAILEKPGMLSPAEFELVKEHVNLALEVLADGPKLPVAVTTGIAQHHERMNGSGYPNGLEGQPDQRLRQDGGDRGFVCRTDHATRLCQCVGAAGRADEPVRMERHVVPRADGGAVRAGDRRLSGRQHDRADHRARSA